MMPLLRTRLFIKQCYLFIISILYLHPFEVSFTAQKFEGQMSQLKNPSVEIHSSDIKLTIKAKNDLTIITSDHAKTKHFLSRRYSTQSLNNIFLDKNIIVTRKDETLKADSAMVIPSEKKSLLSGNVSIETKNSYGIASSNTQCDQAEIFLNKKVVCLSSNQGKQIVSTFVLNN